jgi:hypothetical protein
MLKPQSWFPELKDSVLGFRAATTVLQATLITIPTGTIGTRTSTTIRMRGIRIHIIPLRQSIRTVGIGLTSIIIATTIIASKPDYTL